MIVVRMASLDDSHPRLLVPTEFASSSEGASPRRVVSPAQLILVGLILGVVLMFLYRLSPRHERSPFALFGVSPGMSVGELRKAVVKERGGTMDCRVDFGSYQYCALKYSPDPGMVAAVLDPSKNVIVVEAVSVVGLEGLYAQADSAQAAWNRVAQAVAVPPLVEAGDTGAVRWTSSNRRWTAETHFNGTRDPDVPNRVMLVDTKGVEQLAAGSDQGAEDAKRNGWIPPTEEEVATALEKRRSDRKSTYGAMATTLSQLGDFETAHFNAHHAYTDNVAELPGLFIIGGTNLEIISATDSGWVAKASLPNFPGVSCVAIGGKVAQIDWPVTAGGRSLSSPYGVTCDPMPAAPSAGS